jgi:SAM-dependent methyltransferase
VPAPSDASPEDPVVNEFHLQFLASPEWAAMLEADLVPWLAEIAPLGDDVLEVGPGPGLTTDLLRQRTARLTCVEIDRALATGLSDRLEGTNVRVIHGDATNTLLDDDRFSAATCFGMLHHVPTPKEQDLLFAEMHRVLRPSGSFIGTDGLDTDGTRSAHLDDVFVPIDPNTLPARLEAVGFADIHIEVREFDFRFRVKKEPTISG